MKSALQIAKIAASTALCLFAYAPAVHAAEKHSLPAMTDEKTPPPAIVLALQKATKDLQMPSETDAPFEVVFFAVEDGETEMTPAQIAKLAGAPDEIEVETRDLDEFFEEAATEEDWMDDEEKATAARFAALLEVLKTELKDAQVVVWGDAEKHVAIIGKCENGLAGVTTIVVET